jgi:hypothetical protein
MLILNVENVGIWDKAVVARETGENGEKRNSG